MSEPQPASPEAAARVPSPPRDLPRTILNVAWLAILLGLLMEIIVVIIVIFFGSVPGLVPLVADTCQKITWSFFVCVGLAAGTAVARLRPAAMGLAGLLAAPLAFVLARAVHRGAVQALTVSRVADVGAIPLYLIAIKGLEYACLGLAIGWIGRQPWGGLAAHLVAGLVTGLVFGGVVVWTMIQNSASPLSTAVLVSQVANEVIFPVGCAFVLFAAQSLGRRLS